MIKGDIFFNLSLRSVRLNFLRSMLAAIGIVIGVVAIAAMGMLGTNMQLEVKDALPQAPILSLFHRIRSGWAHPGSPRLHLRLQGLPKAS